MTKKEDVRRAAISNAKAATSKTAGDKKTDFLPIRMRPGTTERVIRHRPPHPGDEYQKKLDRLRAAEADITQKYLKAAFAPPSQKITDSELSRLEAASASAIKAVEDHVAIQAMTLPERKAAGIKTTRSRKK